MKRIILLITVALLSVQFIDAQTGRWAYDVETDSFWDYDSMRHRDLRRNLLTNEEFFEKADLIVECKHLDFLGYYDAKGCYNPDDLYAIFEILVLNVFKGDTALTGKTISFMKKGGVVYKPPVSEGDLPEEVRSRNVSSGLDRGLSISSSYPSIQFLVKSDYPENPDKSKLYPQPKFKPLQNKEEASLKFGDVSWGDRDRWRHGKITGLNDLVFNNREELYQYMSQYKGIIIPKDSDSVRTSIRDSNTPFTPTKVELKDFDRATRKAVQKKWGSPKKKRPNESGNSNTLTLTIANQETIYTAGKYYLEFDLMASTNNPNIYFDGTPFKIEYNTAAFGANVVANNKMTVDIDGAFGNYMLYECADLSVRNAFYVIFGVNIANPVRLPLSPPLKGCCISG